MSEQNSVRRFLVTDAEQQIDGVMCVSQLVRAFHVAVSHVANAIETRTRNGRTTTIYTVMSSRAERVLGVARELGLTVQEVEGSWERETYPYLVGAVGSGWELESQRS